jgi:type VI protein secretion system component Hcp
VETEAVELPEGGSSSTGARPVGKDPGPISNILGFGVENPTTIGSATGGAGGGKIKFNEFAIKKTTDSASPNFFKHCVAGAHYPKFAIHVRKAGGDPLSAGKPFLDYKFGTVFTTEIDWSGPGDEGPEESITFVYGKLGVMYVPQQPQHGNSSSSTCKWCVR